MKVSTGGCFLKRFTRGTVDFNLSQTTFSIIVGDAVNYNLKQIQCNVPIIETLHLTDIWFFSFSVCMVLNHFVLKGFQIQGIASRSKGGKGLTLRTSLNYSSLLPFAHMKLPSRIRR